MKYEDTVREICGDDWRTVSAQERDGGYGLACAIAFVRGVRPNLSDLATHLAVRPDEIATGFNRLQKNGIFSHDYDLRHDADFCGENGFDPEDRAKAHIAALSGGFMGKPWVMA